MCIRDREIETAARNRLGTLTIVFNNGLMGDYEKHIGKSTKLYGTRYITGDYAKIGEGLGAYTEKVDKPDGIIPAVKRALAVNADGKPALLEIITREETAMSKYWK